MPNIAAEVVNYLGYDAQTMGNHDVETGHAVYDKWTQEVKCPMLGANIISIGDAVAAGIDTSLLPAYIAGTVVAAVSGYFAIRLVNSLADKGKFGSFAYYCWGIGAAAVIATLIFH